MAMQIKGLLHEIGHVFFEQYWGDTSIEMRKSLVNAFEEFLDKNPNFRPDAKSYDAKFKEWLADQVAAWVAADKIPRTAIERWFKELADALRRAWAAILNAYPLSDAVSNYIHDVITTYDSKLDPSLDSLGAANSVFYDDMSDAVRQPPEILRQLGTKVRAFKAKHPTLGKMLDTITGTIMAAHEAATARLHMRIRRLNNPVFNQILRVFHHAAGESGGFTYDTLVANRIRNFTQRYDAIVAGVEDEAAFFEIMRNEQAIDSMPEKFQKPAKEMRDLLNQLYAYQVEAGLPIQFVAYYFPQVGDAYELAKPDAGDTIYRAIQDAGVKWNTPQGEVDITMDMVRGWVESLSDDTTSINFDPGRIEDVQSNMRAPFQQALRARVLQPQVREVIRNIKNEKGQARFYAKSMDEVMHRYIRQAVRRAEYNRIFGEDARNIPPSQNDPRQPARPWNPHAKFEQMMNESKAEAWQKELMYDAMSAFLGNYGRIRSEPVRRMVKSVAFYQNLRTLLLVTISSFPEFATLFLRTGNFGRTWRVIRENAADAWRKGGDTYKMLRTLGFAVDELDAFAFKEFYDARDYDSKINRLNEAWFRAIGLTRWTNFIRGLSLHVSLDYMKEHARRVADGFDETGDSQRRLEELGISVEDLRTWARLGEPIHGQIGATIEDVRRGKSNMTEEELAVVERVTGATTRMINEIVVNPTAAMKPLWRSSERASLVSQLGSFTYGFLDTVLPRVWHELTRQGAPTMARAVPLISLAMMLPIAALGLELKELFQYTIWGKEPRTDGMSGPEYLQTLISRTGVLGVAQLGVDAYEAASYGRDPIGVLLGPTVSQVNSAFRDIGKAQDTSRAVIKTTLGAIPFLSSAPGARDRLTPEPEN